MALPSKKARQDTQCRVKSTFFMYYSIPEVVSNWVSVITERHYKLLRTKSGVNLIPVENFCTKLSNIVGLIFCPTLERLEVKVIFAVVK